MKKIYFLLCCILLFTNCTYYTIKHAIENAENGNYIQSLNTINKHISDEYAIKGFETVYPKAETAFKTRIMENRNNNLMAYTKALSQLLYIQDLYLKIPYNIRNKMKITPPTLDEINGIKRELANSFYKLGQANSKKTYFDKLHTYGFFKEASRYNIDNLTSITKAFEMAQKNATGYFLITVGGNFTNTISSSIYPTIVATLNKYPLFNVGNSNNYNIVFNVSAINFSYIPSDIKTQNGTGSYTKNFTQSVMKKVVETEYVNGKKVETTKWTPTFEDVEVRIDYRYIEYIKTSTISFELGYNIYEKNGNPLYSGSKKITVSDKVEWTEYYPLKPIIGVPFSEYLISEPEKFNISKEQLMEKAKSQAQQEIKKIVETLYSSQKINLIQ